MECSVARESLSARLDGEAEPVPAARLDEHLSQCPDCRRWYAAVTESTRRLRLAPGPPVPDLGKRILAAVPAPARRRSSLFVAAAPAAAHGTVSGPEVRRS